ncbi:MAG: SDR family oxidoreductase [Dehalococcoidales bacterium]|nr:SDR family oxidoreductase [Dehalococcoidales bacterium]
MDFRLDNKVAMVTGAASGIGLACAEMLAEGGAKVALVDYNPETLAKATRKVAAKGTAKGYQLDVTDIPRIATTVSRIREEMGEIDILVCSAGVNIRQPAHEVTEEAWDTINNVNIKGLFFCNQAVAVQSMIPRKSGAIVNIASNMGLVGGPKRTAYCASKGAVVQLTRAEAVDWAPYNIRINAVAPTWVLTELTRELLKDQAFSDFIIERTPLQRLASVEEVAAAVCFLASDQAGIITGVILPVDGGWTAQ